MALRPNLVRADTLDLQDPTNPSAAEHHKHSPDDNVRLAPHQAAQIHHVNEERHSEEQALSDAWNASNGDLVDEPGAIDEAQAHMTSEHATAAEGGEGEHGGGGGENATGQQANSDSSDPDDDMLDRMSSSPSIDDGGYTPLHYISAISSPCSSSPSSPPPASMRWPARVSSLSPSPAMTFSTPSWCASEDWDDSESTTTTQESSPFLRTPLHLPLRVGLATEEGTPLQLAIGGESSICSSSPSSSLSSPQDGTYKLSPAAEAYHAQSSESPLSQRWRHHQMGRYGPNGRPGSPSDKDEHYWTEHEGPLQLEEYAPESISETKDRTPVIGNPATRPIESPFRKHRFMPGLATLHESHLEHSASFTSLGSVDLADVLLPVEDPLLDVPLSPGSLKDPKPSMPMLEQSLPDRKTGCDDDAADGAFLELDEHLIDSEWEDEGLPITEDIDFDFVYALHTFVATVEGQANATKGDTMVLLDDTNSYWWLVRVVKDSSIGYLPAEHIETPRERLARLNKHRNIDLSATMLSDNSEKPRNPLKKLRRRNVKTVQFAAPTYHEASDYYDTEDEEQASADEPLETVTLAEETQQNGEQTQPEINGDKAEEEERASTPPRGSFEREQAATAILAPLTDEPQLSPKLVDKSEAAPLKSSRKGTPRNTDSFLKDDGMETRKITLTPGLLREDSVSSKSPSSESMRTESTRGNSTENLVKQISPPEPLQVGKNEGKEKKKEKQKGGLLSGLFKSKKKDKKLSKEDAASLDTDASSIENQLDYSPRSSPLPSATNSPIDRPVASQSPIIAQALQQQQQDARMQGVARQTLARGKVQKVTRSPFSGDSPVREQARDGGSNAFVAELEGSNAAYEMPTGDESEIEDEPQGNTSSTADLATPPSRDGQMSAIAGGMNFSGEWDRERETQIRPTKAKRTKQRVELDDFDSPADEADPSNPFHENERRGMATPTSTSRDGVSSEHTDHLSESPVVVPSSGSFMHGTESVHIPAPGPDEEDDEDEPEEFNEHEHEHEHEHDHEEADSLSTSPSLIEHPNEESHDEESADDLDEDEDATPTAPRSPLLPLGLAHASDQNHAPNQALSTPAERSIAPTLPGNDQDHHRSLTPTASSQPSFLFPPPSPAFPAFPPPPPPPTIRSPTPTPPTTTTTPALPATWSDSGLRAWYDDLSEVKEMLIRVRHDPHGSGVVAAVGPDHPLMADLFVQEREGVQAMMGELDGLLGAFLGRRGVVGGV